MQFRVLGPLAVRAGNGQPIVLGAPKHRVLLSMLLLNCGRVVSGDQLIDALWPCDPPRSAPAVLRTYASALRSALSLAGSGAASLAWVRGSGFRLRLPPGELDLTVFQELADQGQRAAAAGDLSLAAERMHGALALWRGRPAEDVSLHGPVLGLISALEERHLELHEAWVEARLAIGHHVGLIADLRTLLAANPSRERLAELLMLALYRCGRQAEALAVYADTRRWLMDELGVEPGLALRRLQHDILSQQEPVRPSAMSDSLAGTGRLGLNDLGSMRGITSAAAVATAASRPVQGVVPRQLPPAVRHFVGRTAELRRLTALARQASGPGGAVVIVVIDGTAGVGKTALAVSWARQADVRFPDGQLYVDLRGFGPTGSPMRPDEAIRGFLDALAAPSERIPADPAAQIGLYRSLLAERRMLIVLDNAHDAHQVRPLLPATPGCMAVITSRYRMPTLTATEDARPLSLSLLTPPESRGLLAARLGAERLAAQPRAVDEIIAACAGLPLALSVVTACAAQHPQRPLSATADELRGSQDILDAFDTGDAATDMRAVFSWSYRLLGHTAARMFRLLGRHPGPHVTVPSAAAAAGCPRPEARRLLSELTRAHLLADPAPGRYAFHDLLRAYASSLSDLYDSPADQREALRRVLDHCLGAAHAAAPKLDPFPVPPVPVPRPAPDDPPPADHRAAMAWFGAEHAVLLAAVEQAAQARFDEHAWRLAALMSEFFDRRALWREWAATGRIGLACARRLNDRSAEARMHCSLGSAYSRLGQTRRARAHLNLALRLLDGLDDSIGRAQVRRALSMIYMREGRNDKALEHALECLRLCRQAGFQAGEAWSDGAVGRCHALLGNHESAITHCLRAVPLLARIGDRRDEALAWDSLGVSQHGLHRYAEAIASYQRALAIMEGLRHPGAADVRARLDAASSRREIDAADRRPALGVA